MVLLGVIGAGCSSDDGETTGPTSGAPAPSPSVGASTIAGSAVPETRPDSTLTSAGPTIGSTVASGDTIATVPERGVPGIDSADPFCRAWSEFAGSYQALAFASAGGSDPAAAARLEVVAAGTVTSAAQALADGFPDPIASEREVFVDDVIGPFTRRASRAFDELLAAGLAPDEIGLLGDAWLVALVDADGDGTDIVATVPAELSARVDAAVAVFSADVPTIVDDPSLITEAQAPATLGYLADNCPDQGILAGNDAID
jgi:hypothetical protein